MIGRIARGLLRPGYLYINETTATRDCQHLLTYQLHPSLRMCCGCGHTVPTSYIAAIIREAFQ